MTRLDISKNDVTYPGDRSNLEALQGMEPLPHLVERFVAPSEKKMRSWLAGNAVRVAPPARLDTLVRMCGEILGLEMIPEVYVASIRQVNAFTTGREGHPILVVCSPTLRVLGDVEMQALVAHELAHVKCEHVLYHTLAESLAAGAGFVAPFVGAGFISLPLRMLLLAWHRDSEVSADRASVLVVNDFGAFESLMAKLLVSSDSNVGADHRGGSISELFHTHPAFGRRVQLAREFVASQEFLEAQSKVRRRAETSGILVTVCRFCDSLMQVSEYYCPSCGRSQH